jgi:hypothetical protein
MVFSSIGKETVVEALPLGLAPPPGFHHLNRQTPPVSPIGHFRKPSSLYGSDTSPQRQVPSPVISRPPSASLESMSGIWNSPQIRASPSMLLGDLEPPSRPFTVQGIEQGGMVGHVGAYQQGQPMSSTLPEHHPGDYFEHRRSRSFHGPMPTSFYRNVAYTPPAPVATPEPAPSPVMHGGYGYHASSSSLSSSPAQPQPAPRIHHHHHHHYANANGGGGAAAAALKSEKGKIPEKVDFKLLENVPAWLRSLRLHKYTPLFEGKSWNQMVYLSDSDLEKMGVNALGARRKLIKVFHLVRRELGEDIPEDEPSSSVPTTPE